MLKFTHWILAGSIFLISCSKKDSNPVPAPSNLVINATISIDSSGKVDFTATASNAVTYFFDFGDGYTLESSTGKVSHTFTLVGTHDYNISVTAKGSTGLVYTGKKTISVIYKVPELKLVWFDEFDVNGKPDGSKWGYDIGTGSNGWGNNELEYYTDRIENAYIENGSLFVKAIKENFGGKAYTSARMLTKGKFEFSYGKVEVRAKLPSPIGTWPAIWMLGTDIGTVGWPACGEIDIMEHRGSDINRIVAALHYPGRSGGNPNSNTKLISNATSEFHVYKLEWTQYEIKFSIDDVPFHTVVPSSSMPFYKNFFLLLNVAMGGTFGGDVDPAFTNAAMEVDYVRIYQ
ncbi:MAG: family 16 glycosylhydrolase [Chitinophagaceae bacterium]